MRVCLVILSLCLLSSAGLFAGEGGVGRASVVVETYGSVPGGVVLESTAAGFQPISSITYDKKRNVFTLNGNSTYACPIKGIEFRDILKALIEDDLIGVSLNREQGQFIVFGQIGRSSTITQVLLDADKVLMGVIFAIPAAIGDVKLPGGFKPQAPESRPTNIVACVTLTNFRFGHREGTTEYTRAGFTLQPVLMPVLKEKTEEGGHLPDRQALQADMIAKEDHANARHLEANRDAFASEVEVVGKAVAYGEAASFARLVRDSGVDLKVFLKQF